MYSKKKEKTLVNLGFFERRAEVLVYVHVLYVYADAPWLIGIRFRGN